MQISKRSAWLISTVLLVTEALFVQLSFAEEAACLQKAKQTDDNTISDHSRWDGNFGTDPHTFTFQVTPGGNLMAKTPGVFGPDHQDPQLVTCKFQDRVAICDWKSDPEYFDTQKRCIRSGTAAFHLESQDGKRENDTIVGCWVEVGSDCKTKAEQAGSNTAMVPGKEWPAELKRAP